MNVKRMNTWAALLPLFSVGVAAFIVQHEYARGSRLRADIAQGTREIQRLSKLHPGQPVHDHDDHDGHNHDERDNDHTHL